MSYSELRKTIQRLYDLMDSYEDIDQDLYSDIYEQDVRPLEEVEDEMRTQHEYAKVHGNTRVPVALLKAVQAKWNCSRFLVEV